MPEPALATPPGQVWRVERTHPPLRPSRISAVDGGLDNAGNRFDVPGGGVLYAATTPSGAFAEVLAGFRPSAFALGALAKHPPEPWLPAPGTVPVEWRESRRLRAIEIPDPLPFLDVESPLTHTHLTWVAASVLTSLGVERLDVAAVRGSSRLLTRGLAAWAYSRTDAHGVPLYAGIRYVSRLGDHECWAIFDGTPTILRDDQPITPETVGLQETALVYGLRIE